MIMSHFVKPTKCTVFVGSVVVGRTSIDSRRIWALVRVIMYASTVNCNIARAAGEGAHAPIPPRDRPVNIGSARYRNGLAFPPFVVAFPETAPLFFVQHLVDLLSL